VHPDYAVLVDYAALAADADLWLEYAEPLLRRAVGDLAAAGQKDGQTLADFSSRGIPGDPRYHPTLTAPGVDIASARATTGVGSVR
jgi:hypothetical protein